MIPMSIFDDAIVEKVVIFDHKKPGKIHKSIKVNEIGLKEGFKIIERFHKSFKKPYKSRRYFYRIYLKRNPSIEYSEDFGLPLEDRFIKLFKCTKSIHYISFKSDLSLSHIYSEFESDDVGCLSIDWMPYLFDMINKLPHVPFRGDCFEQGELLENVAITPPRGLINANLQFVDWEEDWAFFYTVIPDDIIPERVIYNPHMLIIRE